MELLLNTLPNSVKRDDRQLIERVGSYAQDHMYPKISVMNQEAGKVCLVELPYHNFNHALDVAVRAVEYSKLLEERGARVDHTAFALSGLLHDIYFPQTPQEATRELRGTLISPHATLRTKEGNSAVRAKALLEKYKFDRRRTAIISRMIHATAASNTPRTLSQKALVRADLDGITKDFSSFFAGTQALVEEASLLSPDTQKSPLDRIAVLHEILCKYTSHDLSFGQYEDDYKATFENPALSNIARIGRDTVRDTIRSVGGRALSLLPI